MVGFHHLIVNRSREIEYCVNPLWWNTLNCSKYSNFNLDCKFRFIRKVIPYVFTFRERQRQVRKWQQQQRARQSNFTRPNQLKQREASVTVRPDWVVLEEMDKTQLLKLSLPTVSEPEDLWVLPKIHLNQAFSLASEKKNPRAKNSKLKENTQTQAQNWKFWHNLEKLYFLLYFSFINKRGHWWDRPGV